MTSSSSWATSLLLAFATHASSAPATPFVFSPSDPIIYGLYNTIFAFHTLNKNWYNDESGLWGELWWNSANALTTIGDFARISPFFSMPFTPRYIIENTFNQAQHVEVQTTKSMNFSNGGIIQSRYCINGIGVCDMNQDGTFARRGFTNFINEFYDDEGWWALALIRAYDVLHDSKYLDAVVTIFKDMETGLGGPCRGGIFWSKDREYVNAIANELYLSVAASLALRIPSEPKYLKTAKDQWSWFKNSGMINSDNLINDGLDGNCNNNGQTTWTYNQGVILGGLVELWRVTDDKSLLDEASKIAKAAIAKLSGPHGILRENGGCERIGPDRCGQDGQQFKGVFIRNLGYLQLAAPHADFRTFILANADSIWINDREQSSNKLGAAWAGPYYNATSSSHSSALDALVAALAVAGT